MNRIDRQVLAHGADIMADQGVPLNYTVASGSFSSSFSRATKQQIQAGLERALAGYIRRMDIWIKKNVPKSSGALRQSGERIIRNSRITGIKFNVYFGFDAQSEGGYYYARAVDKGLLPGTKPPAEALEQWIVSKGLGANIFTRTFRSSKAQQQRESFAQNLSWHIYHYGTKGKHFWEPGKRAAERIWLEELNKHIPKKIVVRLRRRR